MDRISLVLGVRERMHFIGYMRYRDYMFDVYYTYCSVIYVYICIYVVRSCIYIFLCAIRRRRLFLELDLGFLVGLFSLTLVDMTLGVARLRHEFEVQIEVTVGVRVWNKNG